MIIDVTYLSRERFGLHSWRISVHLWRKLSDDHRHNLFHKFKEGELDFGRVS